jgi:cell division cycle 14
MPFNKDFGPLNLAMVHRYCRELAKLYKVHCQNNTRIFHYCTTDKNKMTNAAFLMMAFMIVILKTSAIEAYDRFKEFHPALKSFRDASKGDCYYECTVFHCL